IRSTTPTSTAFFQAPPRGWVSPCTARSDKGPSVTEGLLNTSLLCGPPIGDSRVKDNRPAYLLTPGIGIPQGTADSIGVKALLSRVINFVRLSPFFYASEWGCGGDPASGPCLTVNPLSRIVHHGSYELGPRAGRCKKCHGGRPAFTSLGRKQWMPLKE